MIQINCSPKLAVVCLLLLFAATTSNAQDPAPTPSHAPAASEAPATTKTKGRIFFYRIKQFTGSALEPSVFCDEKELARMDNGRYFAIDLEPGEHTCNMGDKQTGFTVTIKEGEEHYAKVTIETGFWKGRGRLTLLQKEQGAFELKKVKPLDVAKVKDRSLVTVYEGSEAKQ